MAPTDGSDSLDLRVLSHLTSGASTATGVAGELGEPESEVAPILERAVADETVMVLDLPGMPTYALTQKGLAALGVTPAAETSADEPAEPASAPPQTPAARLAPVPAAPSAPSAPLASSAPPMSAPPDRQKVVWRHVLYAAVYVVVGLFLLILQPIVGLLAIAAGIVLGVYTLRPLYGSGRTRVNDR